MSKIFSVVLLFTIVLVSCGSSANDNQESKEVNSQELDSVSTAKSSDDIVSFRGIDNQTISTEDLKGKVVFINFWATWCPPCIEEMPSIQILYDKFKNNKDIVFLLVDVDGDLQNAEKFMKNNKLDMPLYIPDSDLPESFIQGAIPTTVILDKRGNIDVRLEGGRDYSSPSIAKALESLLAE